MARNRRFQIPVNEVEDQLIHKAARHAGLSAAEWARRKLKSEAERTLSGATLTAAEALEGLRDLDAPVADIDQMIRESMEGRYGKLP